MYLEMTIVADTYWQGMTLEAAVFARCFIEYTSPDSTEASCSGIGLNTSRMMDDAGIPVVMAFAFFVQENCNLMLDAIEEFETLKAGEDFDNLSDDEQDFSALERSEEEMYRRVCILGEMLKIACCLDYTDELGRRKMFLVIRQYLRFHCLDVLDSFFVTRRIHDWCRVPTGDTYGFMPRSSQIND